MSQVFPSSKNLMGAITNTDQLFGIPMQEPHIYTTNQTASIEDVGFVVLMNSGSANSYTIQRMAAMAKPFPLYSYLIVGQLGAGDTSVVAGTGVTLNGIAAGTVTFANPGDIAAFWQYDTDAWFACNRIAAA